MVKIEGSLIFIFINVWQPIQCTNLASVAPTVENKYYACVI